MRIFRIIEDIDFLPDSPFFRARAGGYPVIQNVWWTCNSQIITQASQGQEIYANVRLKAVEGSISGTVTIRIRKDISLSPDEDYVIKTFSINLND